MDAFRWILLGIGIAVVVAVYFWGRARRRDSAMPPLKSAYNLPSVTIDDDGWVDGVGPVRVVQLSHAEEDVKPFSCDSVSLDEDNAESSITQAETQAETQAGVVHDTPVAKNETGQAPAEAEVTGEAPAPAEAVEQKQPASTEQIDQDAVVVMYVIAPRCSEMKGEQILSATYATRLQYGEMKIFHRKDDQGNTEFSMANMKEPGWFDEANMNTMTTRGISLFIQLDLCRNPVKALDDMLLCAYTMAGMLGAQICDQNRQLLNESITQELRSKAKQFAKNKTRQPA
jgi:cell division protein ZipA